MANLRQKPYKHRSHKGPNSGFLRFYELGGWGALVELMRCQYNESKINLPYKPQEKGGSAILRS